MQYQISPLFRNCRLLSPLSFRYPYDLIELLKAECYLSPTHSIDVLGLLQGRYQWGFGGRWPLRNISSWGELAAVPPARPTIKGLRGTASLALPTLQQP